MERIFLVYAFEETVEGVAKTPIRFVDIIWSTKSIKPNTGTEQFSLTTFIASELVVLQATKRAVTSCPSSHLTTSNAIS